MIASDEAESVTRPRDPVRRSIGEALPTAMARLKRISVVVADNHPLILRGVEALFRAERDIALVGLADTSHDALRMISTINPDVAVLDLGIAGKGALDVLEALRKAGSKTRPVIFAAGMTESQFRQAIQCGARGIIFKEKPPATLVHCVRLVHAGDEFLDMSTFLRMIGNTMDAKTQFAGALTAREFAVVRLVVDALSNKQIARELNIAEGTVKVHLHRVYEKLHVTGRMSLVQAVRQDARGRSVEFA